MKITKLTLYSVQPRWLFLKIDTDEGISGWGEPVVEGHAHTVQAAVEELSSYLIGQDPLRVEDHWQVMYRAGFYRGGPVMMSAMAGVDQALWDIKGKYHGLPIYEMLGGACRDKLKVYCWIGGDRPDDILRQAQEKFAQGYRAVKMNATEELHYIDTYDKVDAVLGRVAAIRDALGNEMDIAVDFHGRVHKSMAKILAHELEPLRPMFIEEPVLPQNNEALREIAGHTAIPIATGERFIDLREFEVLMARHACQYVRPDVCAVGGITASKKICALAEAHDVLVIPHNPLGPVSTAACLQICASISNLGIQELPGFCLNGAEDKMVKEPLRFENGCMLIPEAPGIGVELADDAEDLYPANERGSNAARRAFDGSVKDW